MRYSRKKFKPGKIRLRILLVGIFFTLLYCGIAGRVVYLQVVCGDMLASRASGQYTRTLVTSGKRGTIYDRNHTELAVTVDATSIGIHPSLIPNSVEVAPKLARALNMETKAVRSKLISRQPFVWLKRAAMADEVSAVKQLNLAPEAIAYVPEQRRVYPGNAMAAQLIGFTGIDGNGLEGIEFTWDEYLRGASVRQTILMDAKKRRLGAGEELSGSVDGHNVVLTIDGAIQYIAETALEKAVVDSDADHGMAIVMDPNTGEILAMANYPFFDLNRFGDYHRDLWRNRVVADAFEPGSVMKVFLAAGSIESGMCTPDTVFDCENGAYRIHGHTINDTHRHGWMTVRDIIKTSSNIGAVKISEKIGRKMLWEILRNFGFNTKPEVECPGNAEGRLSYYTQWTDVDMSTIAFGQGISATAVQLVTAVSAIANGGLLMKPYVVSSVVSPDGQVARRRDREIVRRVISETTAEHLKEMMTGVTTEGGTGVNAAVEGYSVCGKTGTAQKLDKDGRYSNRDYISSFLGFAPQHNPRVAVMVIVDSPRKAYYASVVAAPAFKQIVRETLNYFGVLPETDHAGKNLMVQADGGGNG